MSAKLSWEQLGLGVEAAESLFSSFHFARYMNVAAMTLKKALIRDRLWSGYC